ncbi:hypothetical protein AaE_010152 [Aphanomyces astaci]|uniref:Uncharacterized protein n=1 Tax=Aphanomyces astaci TaxID=112090 RepID=A0A6A5A601_APHAT|nr:hypothetical protein AaE_010152 [Aphanomyces astaci]
MKNVHRMSARAVTTNRGYYFHAWRTGVQAAIFGRLQMLSAIQLQAIWRRVLATRQTQHRRTTYAKAAVQIQAVVRGSQRRRQPLPSKSLDERRRSAFLVYAQSLNHDVAVACETRRQQAEDNVVKVAELAAVAALKVVQSSKEGTLELTKLAAAERALHVIGTHAVFLRTYGMTKAEAFAVVAQRQVDEALANAQVVARHTFRLLRPPPFACIHPDHRGAASFASRQNYLGHATCSLTTTQIQLHVQLCDNGISGTSDSLKVALRLWNVGQRVLDMTNSTESVAEVAMDVITMPQLPLPLPASSAHEWKLVGQALTAIKKWFHLATLPSSTLLSTDYTPTLERIRLATDLRWQVFRWLVSVVPPPSTTSQSDDPDKLVMRHLHHYDEANKAFYTRWAELEQKKLLGHFQRDASGMLQAVGTLARNAVVWKRREAVHGLHQRASLGYFRLVRERATVHLVKRFHARNGLWSAATQAIEALRARRMALTELQSKYEHAAARVDVAAWLGVCPSISLIVSGIDQRAAWNLRRQVAGAFLLDIATRAQQVQVPDN